MKKLAFAPLRTLDLRPGGRGQLALLLTALLGSAQAQILDTAATVGVASTLQQTQTNPDMAALGRANALAAQLNQQKADQQKQADALNAGANTAPTAAPAPAAPPVAAPTAQPAATAAPAAAAPAAMPLNNAQLEQLSQVREMLSQGNAKQSQTILEGLVAQNYQQPEPHFALGLALYSQKNYAGARFEFNQYATLAPQSFEGQYNLGVIAAELGDHNEALKQFTEAASKSAQANPTARRQVLDALASEQLRRNDYAALITTLTQAQAIDPKDPKLQLQLGQALAYTGKGTDALPLLFAASQQDAYRESATNTIAEIFLAQKLPDRALSSLDSAIAQAENDSDRAQLMMDKAHIYVRLNDKSAAITTARSALQQDSHLAGAYALIGQLSAPKDALSAWKKATELDPNNAAYKLARAGAQLSAGQMTEARQSAQAAASMSTDKAVQARAEFLQGVIAYRQKAYPTALGFFQSSSMKQGAADTSLWLGLSSYALKDYNTALAAFSDSVRLQDTPAAHLNLGATYLALGNFKEAETHLQSAVKLNATSAQGWYQLGLARRALNKAAEAQYSFRQAAQLGYAAANAELK